MVLDFGLLNSGLFRESEAIGDGLGGNQQEKIIFDTETGVYFIGSYFGTGFDSVLTNGGGGGATDTHNYTMALTNTILSRFTKVIVCIGYVASATRVNNWADTSMKVESQETGGGGGGWSNLLASQELAYDGTGSAQNGVASLFLIKTLTQGEKNLGLDIKITSTCTCGKGVNSCNVTNKGVLLFGAA